MSCKYDMLTLIGPTACGKTAVAVKLAQLIGGEIISGDSRQIFRGMTIGTGKDLDEYITESGQVKVHLIDIVNPGEKYSIFNYQHDFHRAYNDIISRGKTPILCGGSGMYVECILRNFRMTPVPENPELRNQLKDKNLEQLTEILKSYGKKLHNTTDTDTPRRAIRAIEIEDYYCHTPVDPEEFPQIRSLNFCLDTPAEIRWQRISERLDSRLKQGMADEIRRLIGMPTADGIQPAHATITPDELMHYGLEYKYVTLYVLGRLKYEEMVEKLNIAIRQFAKRQMTWFRGMERRGIKLNWVDTSKSHHDIADEIAALWLKYK